MMYWSTASKVAHSVCFTDRCREIVIRFDQPWEGNTSSGCTVFRDDDRYRMYYRATQGEDLAGYWCYAESNDGIHWTRPDLGLVEYGGSRQNNILSRTQSDTGNPVVFRDENPAAAPDARYKAVAIRYRKHAGEGRTADAINDWWATIEERSLTLWKSPDGIHWTQMQEEGVFRNEGYFDSQNVAFWDSSIQAYRAYFREICHDSAHLGGIRRDIKTGTSLDFIYWNRGRPCATCAARGSVLHERHSSLSSGAADISGLPRHV